MQPLPPFTDIAILGLDARGGSPLEERDGTRFAGFKLTARPPRGWARLFESAWLQTPGRGLAEVIGDRLMIEWIDGAPPKGADLVAMVESANRNYRADRIGDPAGA